MYLHAFIFFICLNNKYTFAHYLSGNFGKNLKYPTPWRGQTSPGDVWPKPQFQTTSTTQLCLNHFNFSFQYDEKSFECELLDEAFKRYSLIIRKSFYNVNGLSICKPTQQHISTAFVNLRSRCEEYPHLEMNETYTLKVAFESLLESQSVWGILRGLETFSQLAYVDGTSVVMNETSINDFPRFKHRGVLLDTSRHFLPLHILKENLDAMGYNKYNVFHWHIVDYQSFPYVSKIFPKLSANGAFTQLQIYTPLDVQDIIEYARFRGIRVVPEFDTPGHADSWENGQSGLLTPCYDTKGVLDGTYGPVNPIVESTYIFIETFFKEIRNVFPDEYIHLGGDEVNFHCWKSNPVINAWMKKYNISGNYAKLEEYYIDNVLNISSKLGFQYIVWQEVVDNGCKVNDKTIVEVWIDSKTFMEHVAKFTKMGLRTIITAPWYLNRVGYGEDWVKFYAFEPLNFNGTETQKKLVIGGEACMWGEFVDEINVMPKLWPRACAVSERLWSNEKVKDHVSAAPRIHQQRCRMLKRGITAEPLRPGYCE